MVTSMRLKLRAGSFQ